VTRSHLLYRSALVDSLAIYFIFSKPYCIFYAFLNFTRFSENVQEIEKFKKMGAQWAGVGLMVPALLARPASHFCLPTCSADVTRRDCAVTTHNVRGVVRSPTARR
jgi:hypothetical protein